MGDGTTVRCSNGGCLDAGCGAFVSVLGFALGVALLLALGWEVHILELVEMVSIAWHSYAGSG